MTDLKTTLVDLKAALQTTLDAMESADADVKAAIESEETFFSCVQARNTALQTAITEKVKRTRGGFLCQGTPALLRHVAGELGAPQAKSLMKSDERVRASKLALDAESLAVDAQKLVDDMKAL